MRRRWVADARMGIPGPHPHRTLATAEEVSLRRLEHSAALFSGVTNMVRHYQYGLTSSLRRHSEATGFVPAPPEDLDPGLVKFGSNGPCTNTVGTLIVEWCSKS